MELKYCHQPGKIVQTKIMSKRCLQRRQEVCHYVFNIRPPANQFLYRNAMHSSLMLRWSLKQTIHELLSIAVVMYRAVRANMSKNGQSKLLITYQTSLCSTVATTLSVPHNLIFIGDPSMAILYLDCEIAG